MNYQVKNFVKEIIKLNRVNGVNLDNPFFIPALTDNINNEFPVFVTPRQVRKFVNKIK